MILPVQITFRNLSPSPAVEARIRAEAGKLNRYFERITSCRVIVEAPHRHQKGGAPYRIRIELGVPRAVLVVKHEPSLHDELAHSDRGRRLKHLEPNAAHKDMYVSIRDAFDIARRRLEDYARRLRGDVKSHGRVPAFRKEKLRS
ncbi:MAG TPA: HPF/RaiA family ribosome-associated protein [Opitutaceae bacterium]